MAMLTAFVVALQPLFRAWSLERKPEEFTCDIAQRGYHILGWADCGLKIWKNSKRGEPLLLDYNTADGCAYHGIIQAVRKDIMKAVGLKKRVKYQPRAAYFTSQGHFLTADELTHSLESGAVFLIEGGNFQWPPVEVGFRTVVEGIEVGGRPVELETLAVVPPLFKVHNLASAKETKALIKHAKPRFKASMVVHMDDDDGKPVEEFRTSQDYRPDHNATPLLAKMEARAALTTRMPFSHLETVQVLHYKKGGYYYAHDDAGQLQYYLREAQQVAGKHYGFFDRMLTLFWYMNDVPKGGETNFPMAGGPGGASLPFPPSLKNCTQGIMVKPVAGEAVLWYNMFPHGLVTPYALHGACAVEEGEKYAINVWIYSKPFGSLPAQWDPDHPILKHYEQIAGRKAGTDEVLDRGETRSIKFVNQGDSTVQIYWKGTYGEQLIPDTLPPGRDMIQVGYVGDNFVAKSGDTEVGFCPITADGGKLQTCMIGKKAEL